MLSSGEDLQWPDDVHGVHAGVEGDEDLDRLMGTVRLLIDCTHLVGLSFRHCLDVCSVVVVLVEKNGLTPVSSRNDPLFGLRSVGTSFQGPESRVPAYAMSS